MSSVSIVVRLVLIALLFVAPPAAAGAMLEGAFGALFGAVAGLLFWGVTCLLFERRVRRILGARRAADPGILRTYQRCCEQEGGPAPELWIHEDPSPNLLILRGWKGPGALFVSQGLLQMLPEDELRVIIKYSIRSSQSRQTLLRSMGSAGMSLLVGWAPEAWVQLAWGGRSNAVQETRSLTPGSFLRFSLMLPWVRVLYRLAGRRGRSDRELALAASREFLLASAVRKIVSSLERWEFRPHPGLELLYLCRPGAAARLLPF